MGVGAALAGDSNNCEELRLDLSFASFDMISSVLGQGPGVAAQVILDGKFPNGDPIAASLVKALEKEPALATLDTSRKFQRVYAVYTANCEALASNDSTSN
jgi:hypothetical protein